MKTAEEVASLVDMVDGIFEKAAKKAMACRGHYWMWDRNVGGWFCNACKITQEDWHAVRERKGLNANAGDF